MRRWLPFEWITAIRFLREGRVQTFFIITGIAIGVGVIVFMSSMLSSLQSNFITRVLASQPHIQIIPPEEVARPLRAVSTGVVYAPIVQRPMQRLRSIDQWQTIVQELRGRRDVAIVAATVTTSALAIRGDASVSIAILGADPELYFQIVRIPDYITLGTAELRSDQIIIGSELARKLGVAVGERINVTATAGAVRALTVSGIFDLGNKGANERSVYVALRTAQSLAGLSGGVTAIDVTVTDLYAAEGVAQSIAAGTGMQADSWMKTNAQLFTTLSAQAMSFRTIDAFVALSVAFGIASVLSVSVIQRSADIGILRAMGATQGQMLRVFLLQGGLLGMVGAVGGSILGGGALKLFLMFVRLADGSALFPFAMPASIVVAAIGLAGVTGVLAAAVPAMNAARLDPVVAIRG